MFIKRVAAGTSWRITGTSAESLVTRYVYMCVRKILMMRTWFGTRGLQTATLLSASNRQKINSNWKRVSCVQILSGRHRVLSTLVPFPSRMM